MKTAIRMWILSIISIQIVLIMGCLIQKTNAQSELRSVVSDALLQTTRVVVDERYAIESNEEFMAEFEQNLFRSIDPALDITLDIYYLGADADKNVLSVVVQETAPFVFFPDKRFTVTSQQSVIIDKTQEEITYYDLRYHNIVINLLPESTPYIHIYGEETILPDMSDVEDFSHWEDVNGDRITSIPADVDHAVDIYACWDE